MPENPELLFIGFGRFESKNNLNRKDNLNRKIITGAGVPAPGPRRQGRGPGAGARRDPSSEGAGQNCL